MGLLAWVLRVILFTILLRFVLGLIGAMFGGASRPAAGPRGPRPAPRPSVRSGGTLVRDPQCGTYIPQTRAIRATSDGDPLYFCSEDCRRTYLAAHSAAHSA